MPPLSRSGSLARDREPGERAWARQREAAHVVAEAGDGIGWTTLNRPEELNTLSRERKDLPFEATAAFEHEAAVRCLVIRGNGRHFMAGGNIKEFHEALRSGDRAAYFRRFEARVVQPRFRGR